jgi:hypothetical protein
MTQVVESIPVLFHIVEMNSKSWKIVDTKHSHMIIFRFRNTVRSFKPIGLLKGIRLVAGP